MFPDLLTISEGFAEILDEFSDGGGLTDIFVEIVNSGWDNT